MKKVWSFVSLGLTRVRPTGLVFKVRNCVSMMSSNPAFAAPNPLPDPTLAEVTAAVDKLENAEQAFIFNRGKLEKEARDLAFTELKEMYHLLGGYVQLASGGNKEVILSAGLDTERNPTAAGVPGTPGNVRAEATKVYGQIIVRWGASKGHRVYKMYQTKGDPSLETGWELIAETGKVRLMVDNLDRFNTYSYRVVAQGVGGQSIASDAASTTAA